MYIDMHDHSLYASLSIGIKVCYYPRDILEGNVNVSLSLDVRRLTD